jgi:hypothetical protein
MKSRSYGRRPVAFLRVDDEGQLVSVSAFGERISDMFGAGFSPGEDVVVLRRDQWQELSELAARGIAAVRL